LRWQEDGRRTTGTEDGREAKRAEGEDENDEREDDEKMWMRMMMRKAEQYEAV
jgi:hypothetical protein